MFTDSLGPDYQYEWVTDSLEDDRDYIISLISYDLVGNNGLKHTNHRIP